MPIVRGQFPGAFSAVPRASARKRAGAFAMNRRESSRRFWAVRGPHGQVLWCVSGKTGRRKRKSLGPSARAEALAKVAGRSPAVTPTEAMGINQCGAQGERTVVVNTAARNNRAVTQVGGARDGRGGAGKSARCLPRWSRETRGVVREGDGPGADRFRARAAASAGRRARPSRTTTPSGPS